ncbi:HAD family hydrolase [Streptomyces sp. NBC_00459]|uniref:HAD family hydrolase n=1 Tax=Streptomyces sp. NBC_00459 TaxID=2975749 RepID=UPI002E18E073
MPLLMLDLDNTLVDRDAAFRDATAAFLAEHALPESDIEWLMSTDASGYTSREALATAVAERYGASLRETAIRVFLDRGAADRVVLAEATRNALSKATTEGWSCMIVTNGRTVQQEAKIRNTGLDRLVHGWTISEEVGHKKPDPAIFKAAATAVGASLQEAWIIGDSPQADIAGAHRLDVSSVWVSGGRPWTEAAYRPTHVADNVASAIHYVIGIQTERQR